MSSQQRNTVLIFRSGSESPKNPPSVCISRAFFLSSLASANPAATMNVSKDSRHRTHGIRARNGERGESRESIILVANVVFNRHN